VIDSRTRDLCQKAIDYHCSDLESWVKLSINSQDFALAQKYQLAHNVLISLRQKIESDTWLEEPNLLTYKKSERIYLEANVIIKQEKEPA